jgi:hypothetical protein
MNGADIAMINSPSNTSLSSLGSPGGAGSVHRKSMMIRKRSYFVKNPIGQFESSLGPMEEVLNTSLEEQEVKHEAEEGAEVTEDEKNKSSESENIGECIKILSSETECNDNFEMFQHSKDDISGDSSTGASDDGGVLIASVGNPTQLELPRKTSSEPFNDKTIQTPESGRYQTADESPNNIDDEDDRSNSSFEDSSSEEELATSKSSDLTGQKSPNSLYKSHFLNKPQKKAEQLQDAEEEDNIVLLHDRTDDDEQQNVMDMTSILSQSKISPPIDPSLLETPPTKNKTVIDGILPDESITPKRKTISRQSSIEDLGITDLTSQIDSLESKREINLEDSKLEQKRWNPRKATTDATEKKPQHRRKRSGDVAAASLYAGGPDWAGMEHDKIPLPDQRGIDDDMEYFDNAPNYFTDSRRRSKMVLGTSDSTKSTEIYRSDEVNDVSSHFSPRITRSSPKEKMTRKTILHEEPLLHRNDSFEDRSTTTHDSESNFSWISQRTLSFHAENLFNNRLDPLSNKRSDSPRLLVPPPLERQLGVKNEMKHFQSRIHARSKSDDSGFRSVTSAKYVADLELEEDTYPTYICPRCHTKQREFFTVASARKDSKSGSGGWMVGIFITYMVGALFLFGWEVCTIFLTGSFFSLTPLCLLTLSTPSIR